MDDEKVVKVAKKLRKNVERIKTLEGRMDSIEKEFSTAKRWSVTVILPVLAAIVKYVSGVDIGEFPK